MLFITWASEMLMGVSKTVQVTPSLQPGVVSDPLYR